MSSSSDYRLPLFPLQIWDELADNIGNLPETTLIMEEGFPGINADQIKKHLTTNMFSKKLDDLREKRDSDREKYPRYPKRVKPPRKKKQIEKEKKRKQPEKQKKRSGNGQADDDSNRDEMPRSRASSPGRRRNEPRSNKDTFRKGGRGKGTSRKRGDYTPDSYFDDLKEGDEPDHALVTKMRCRAVAHTKSHGQPTRCKNYVCCLNVTVKNCKQLCWIHCRYGGFEYGWPRRGPAIGGGGCNFSSKRICEEKWAPDDGRPIGPRRPFVPGKGPSRGWKYNKAMGKYRTILLGLGMPVATFNHLKATNLRRTRRKFVFDFLGVSERHQGRFNAKKTVRRRKKYLRRFLGRLNPVERDLLLTVPSRKLPRDIKEHTDSEEEDSSDDSDDHDSDDSDRAIGARGRDLNLPGGDLNLPGRSPGRWSRTPSRSSSPGRGSRRTPSPHRRRPRPPSAAGIAAADPGLPPEDLNEKDDFPAPELPDIEAPEPQRAESRSRSPERKEGKEEKKQAPDAVPAPAPAPVIPLHVPPVRRRRRARGEEPVRTLPLREYKKGPKRQAWTHKKGQKDKQVNRAMLFNSAFFNEPNDRAKKKYLAKKLKLNPKQVSKIMRAWVMHSVRVAA